MRFFTPLLFILFSLSVQAQDTLTLYGLVLSEGKPVYAATVARQSTQMGTSSKFDGSFSLRVMPGETVIFSSIGYKTARYVVPMDADSDSLRVLVSLPVDTVVVSEAVVHPWPKKNMLREAFLSQREESRRKPAPFSGFIDREIEPREPKPSVMNPISFLHDKIGRDARMKRKLQRYRQMVRDAHYYEKRDTTSQRY